LISPSEPSASADLLVSTDDALLQLDGCLTNRRGAKILCLYTDAAFHLL